MPSATSPWGLLRFTEQNKIRLDWDALRIRLLKRGSDLLVVETRPKLAESEKLETDPEAGHRRYAFEKPVEVIRVQPVTPDRPIVVQPLHPLRLAPMATVDFFVSVPLDIQLSTVVKSEDHALERLRSEILSDTWFGDQISGVLGYAIKSRARRECPAAPTEKTARALCKIRIQNKSSEQLHCTKFCLRLDHYHLWQSGAALWTSPVTIRYNGSEHLSAVDYSDRAPSEAPNAEKIADAVEEPLSGLIRRTFAGLGSSLT